ncbi:MAG: DNA repair protein RecO [Patescibacteria group bacterium]
MYGKLYQTRGIIIKKRNYRETDKVLVVLSREYGRIEILARGARKTGNVYSGLLEPMIVGDFYLSKGRTWDTINDMTLVNDYSQYLGKKNLVVYKGVSFILDILYKISVIDKDEKSYFGLLMTYLEGLVNDFQVLQNSDKMKMYLCSFILSVLALSGRLPCFLGCTICSSQDCRDGDGWNLSCQGLVHRYCLANRDFFEPTLVLSERDKVNLENLLVLPGGKFILEDIDRYEIDKLYLVSSFLLSAYLGKDVGMEVFN